MAKRNGLFIVLEGADGSGKGTQFNLLKERLKAIGYEVAVFDFPRYDKPSSHFVKSYLNGEYGPAGNISPYVASMFYALDRFEAGKEISKALEEGKIVLANRYTGSNMAHQGGKIKDVVEQRSFFVWADNLEFQLLGIPRPDLNLYLRVPAETAYEMVAKKNARNYTKQLRDEHEKDLKHLKNSVATYDLMCRLFPKDFRAIECTEKGKLLSIPRINDIIWDVIKPILPANKQHDSHSVIVTLGPDKSPSPPQSQSPRSLTQTYNDASLMLRLGLQRAARVEPEPPFAGWAEYGFNFYTPAGLPKNLAAKYRETIGQIANYHEQLAQRLENYRRNETSQAMPIPSTSQLLLPMTPLCALSAFSLKLQMQDVGSVASKLLADDSAEMQWAGKQLYLAARQQWPGDFKYPLESPDGPVSLNNIIAKLAEDRLPQVFSTDDTIKLLEARPRLEFDLLAESIYPYSSLSLDEIAEEVSNWPYLQKFNSLKQAATQPEVLKNVRYKLDIVSDHIVLDQVLAHLPADSVRLQAFTPRYGYDIPQAVEAAAADAIFDACFDESLKLYSLMQGAGREDSAAYATLLGHRLRWQLNISAEEIKELMDDPVLSSGKLATALTDKISEVHPLLWEIISGSEPKEKPRNGKPRVKPLHRPPAKRKRNHKKT